jgi:hypothetical protein
MTATTRPRLRPLLLALLACLAALTPAPGEPKPDSYWNVDDVRPGMKGTGRTVMKGTRVEDFDVEVLGVMKNTSPGRDLVLCRLSGLDLEKTGVIAGMSGSPVMIDGKLLGAVAYAWPFGKEPIAGVTPFSQMHGFVAAYEKRDLGEQGRPHHVKLQRPLRINEQTYDTVTIASTFDEPLPTVGDGLWMAPLRTPVAATGFTERSLALLRDKFRTSGLIPVQGGGAGSRIVEDEKETKLEPGGPLAVALITGDFDMSGIGTVTHIEGKRVYGWGHPFFGLGTCEFPMMTGYIHTIYPRQTVSFKMGSPLRTVGVMNADVSTCIAGWLDRKPDMLPVKMTIRREADTEDRTFHVEVVRQNSLLDMQGDMPEELTADLHARIEVESHGPIEIKDTYSGNGYSGGRAAQGLYYTVAQIVNTLAYNSHEPIRINKIECETTIRPGRTTAEVEDLELASETYAPGETLKATVSLRPYQGQLQRVPVELKLPPDLPEGSYTVTVSDDVAGVRAKLHENPLLTFPEDLDHLFETLRLQAGIKRTNLVVRVPITGAGVALDGKALPQLPPSMVQMLGNTRRTGTQTMSSSLMKRQATDWVVQGSESAKFTVAKIKKVGLQSAE